VLANRPSASVVGLERRGERLDAGGGPTMWARMRRPRLLGAVED